MTRTKTPYFANNETKYKNLRQADESAKKKIHCCVGDRRETLIGNLGAREFNRRKKDPILYIFDLNFSNQIHHYFGAEFIFHLLTSEIFNKNLTDWRKEMLSDLQRGNAFQFEMKCFTPNLKCLRGKPSKGAIGYKNKAVSGSFF